jgi:hypothetical protein
MNEIVNGLNREFAPAGVVGPAAETSMGTDRAAYTGFQTVALDAHALGPVVRAEHARNPRAISQTEYPSSPAPPPNRKVPTIHRCQTHRRLRSIFARISAF